MEYLRSLFGEFCRNENEVEVRCLLFASLFVGNRLLAADHGKRSREQVTEQALRKLLA
jgi:hypothetical protein